MLTPTNLTKKQIPPALFIRKWFLIILAIPTLYGFTPPNHTGYVTDFTHTLTSTYKSKLQTLSHTLDNQAGIQVATLIIPKLPNTETIESYANKIYEAWGIGHKNTDKGALFVIALTDKKVRIEVGYGLEEILPDAKLGTLLDQHVLPAFRNNQIEIGIIQGHYTLISELAKHHNISLQTHIQPTSGIPHKTPSLTLQDKIISYLLLATIIIGMIISPTFRRVMFLVILSTLFNRGGRHSSSGHFGGTGFGGFGGGLSGGGGASRGW